MLDGNFDSRNFRADIVLDADVTIRNVRPLGRAPDNGKVPDDRVSHAGRICGRILDTAKNLKGSASVFLRILRIIRILRVFGYASDRSKIRSVDGDAGQSAVGLYDAGGGRNPIREFARMINRGIRGYFSVSDHRSKQPIRDAVGGEAL